MIVCIPSLCLVMIIRRFLSLFHARSRVKGIDFYGRGAEYGTTPTPFSNWGRRRHKMGPPNVVKSQQRHLQAASVTRVKRVGVCLEPCEARGGLLRNCDVRVGGARNVSRAADRSGETSPPSALHTAFCRPNESKPEGK